MESVLNFKEDEKILLLIIYLQSIAYSLSAQFTDKWGDQGNGTYVNPVLPGDFSDLDAIKVGNDFYAISSTMQFSPGMAVLHSKDLVNWRIIGHVADDLTRISPNLNWDKMNSYGKGIWAGSIRYYKGKFWVYFGTPDDGFFMSSATNPAGPWEPLHQLWKVKGWDDCCSFCDDDGQLYFIATQFALDPKNNRKYNIHLFKMAPDGKQLIMESDTIIYQANGSEANKLYKINGLYYHYFSQVNSEGRVIMMQRSNSLYGPWEVKQLNHVSSKTDREPNQGGLIQLDNSQWWFFTHHGSGSWEGRVASLLPVNWINGWPIIGQVGADTIGNMVWTGRKPILSKSAKIKLQTSDDFSAQKLLPQWEWNYQPRAGKWSLIQRNGFLRLHAFSPLDSKDKRNIILRAGNTLTQRTLRTRSNIVTVKIDISSMTNGQYAGITHFSTTSNSLLGIKKEQGIRRLFYSYNNVDTTGIVLSDKYIWLQSQWNANGENIYAYSLDGKKFVAFGGRSTLTWGGYRGDRIGVFNFNVEGESGFIDVDYFNYRYSN